MKDYPYPIQKETAEVKDEWLSRFRRYIADNNGGSTELTEDPGFIELHRMGEPCFVRTDRVSYIGPMLGVSTSYCVIDGCPLIIDEGVEEIMSMLCDQ